MNTRFSRLVENNENQVYKEYIKQKYNKYKHKNPTMTDQEVYGKITR